MTPLGIFAVGMMFGLGVVIVIIRLWEEYGE